MEFKCKANCGECCGVIPLNPQLVLNNVDKIQVEPIETIELGGEAVPMTEDGLCIFLRREDKQCMIYDERPSVCRKYGLNDELPCPYIRPNGYPRSPAKVKRMQRQINHDIDFKMKQMENYGNTR